MWKWKTWTGKERLIHLSSNLSLSYSVFFSPSFLPCNDWPQWIIACLFRRETTEVGVRCFSVKQSSPDKPAQSKEENERSQNWSEWIIIQDSLSCLLPDGTMLSVAKNPGRVLSILFLIYRPHSGDLRTNNRELCWKGRRKKGKTALHRLNSNF